MKESNYKEGEDRFDPVHNTHTPLSPTLNKISFFNLITVQKDATYSITFR